MQRSQTSLEVHDWRAGSLLAKLEGFLGEEAISRRLKSIERELQIERGVYRRHWVLPHREWWLGLKEARQIRSSGASFRGRLTPRLMTTLETAAKISLLFSGMPQLKRLEFRQRILGADNLRTVTMELDIAGHFAQKGCRLEWCTGSIDQRIPEFIVREGSTEWEIECKTKGTDAGRRVSRPGFYRLVDLLGNFLTNYGLQGTCEIRIPDRIPIDPNWRAAILEAVKTSIDEQRREVTIWGDHRITLDLKPHDGRLLREEEVKRTMGEKNLNEHVAFYGPIRSRCYVDPICIKLKSEKPDRYLEDILKDLRDASRQFSGHRAAVICCFIPEVDSFKGLEKTSALQDMTGFFFEKHAPTFVHSVVYSSDTQEEDPSGRVRTTFMPALRFGNHRSTVFIPENMMTDITAVETSRSI